MYHFHEKNVDVLPKAKDGNMDYGLVRSCMALEIFKYDGDEYKKQRGIIDPSDEGRVEF
jgi:hypothetical protein